MHVVTSLTVAAGKRLIAKGVAAFPPVKRALAQGTVAVGSGSTNGYIIEELTGEPFAKHSFVTGHTLVIDGGMTARGTAWVKGGLDQSAAFGTQEGIAKA